MIDAVNRPGATSALTAAKKSLLRSAAATPMPTRAASPMWWRPSSVKPGCHPCRKPTRHRRRASAGDRAAGRESGAVEGPQ